MNKLKSFALDVLAVALTLGVSLPLVLLMLIVYILAWPVRGLSK